MFQTHTGDRRRAGQRSGRGRRAALLAALLAAGCSGAASDSAKGPGGSAPETGSGNGSGSGANSGTRPPGPGSGPALPDAGAGDSGPPPMVPETEVRQDFEAPRGGARFVYVANRRRDTVAVIDSTGLGIRTVAVGDAPVHLATVPGQDVALVLNQGTRDVNVLRTDAAGATSASRLPVVAGANRLSIAADGGHALAWFDSGAAPAGALGGSFQEVSVLTLLPGGDSAADVTVGFRPSDVVFSRDGSGAFVVTEDGVSVIRFASLKGPAVAPFVRFPDAGANAAPVRDVSVTPDGRFAVARREGAPQVMLLDLGPTAGASSVHQVDLGSPATDLDLSPDGSYALAVLRAENAYLRLRVPEDFLGPPPARQLLAGEVIGSAALSADGATAVFYTTAAEPPVERLVVVGLAGPAAGGPPLAVPLKKAVRAVAIAPDGRTAIVLHNKSPGDPRENNLDVETQIDRSYGYTVVNLATGFPKLQLTTADVTALALTPDGSRAFVLVPGPRLVQRIALGSFIVDEFPVGSPPQSLSVLSAAVKRVFVSQEHPEGRISFIDWETGAVESVTGFELNGRIVQ